VKENECSLAAVKMEVLHFDWSRLHPWKLQEVFNNPGDFLNYIFQGSRHRQLRFPDGDVHTSRDSRVVVACRCAVVLPDNGSIRDSLLS
jgi:hypothetical protein